MIAIRDLSEAQIEQILDKTGISPFKGGYIYYNFEEPERYIWSIDKELVGKDEFYVVLDIFHRLESLRSQMNIDKVETQTEHQEEMSAFKSNPIIQLSIDELDKFDSEPDSAFASVNDAVDSVEWNGEGLPPVGVECEWIGGGLNHGDWGAVIVRAYNDDYAWIEKLHDKSMHTVRNPAHFRKPETPQQREDRERLEAAKDLYREYMKPWGDKPYVSFDSLDPKNTEAFLMLVDKTNYRKGVK